MTSATSSAVPRRPIGKPCGHSHQNILGWRGAAARAGDQCDLAWQLQIHWAYTYCLSSAIHDDTWSSSWRYSTRQCRRRWCSRRRNGRECSAGASSRCFAAIGAPDIVRMQRQTHDTSVFRTFSVEGVELVLDHLQEVIRRAIPGQHARVIGLAGTADCSPHADVILPSARYRYSPLEEDGFEPSVPLWPRGSLRRWDRETSSRG
jgi:hypothetical protein